MPNTIKLTHEKEYTKEELLALANSIPEETVLKYPNGAVIHAPRDGIDYWYISTSGEILEIEFYLDDDFDQFNLQSQNVFLTEEEAEKALYVESIHNKYLKKITEINAQNNWVADWSDGAQYKYCISWSWYENSKRYDYIFSPQHGGVIYMCEEAADYMMSDEVSINDFKAFLKMYNEVEVI